MDAGDDWRAQLQPAACGRIVNKMYAHSPFFMPPSSFLATLTL